MKAIWNGVVLAESDQTVLLEGNHYFPLETVRREHLTNSRAISLCPWKGVARYYTVEVDAQRNRNAGWYYPRPFPWIRNIRDHVAFWNGVEVRP